MNEKLQEEKERGKDKLLSTINRIRLNYPEIRWEPMMTIVIHYDDFRDFLATEESKEIRQTEDGIYCYQDVEFIRTRDIQVGYLIIGRNLQFKIY